jgi:hypothetical protein
MESKDFMPAFLCIIVFLDWCEKSRSNQEFFNQVVDEPLLQMSKI